MDSVAPESKQKKKKSQSLSFKMYSITVWNRPYFISGK